MTPRTETTLVVIHCSATRPSADIGAKEIRRWHVVDNKWSDIGYHFVIRRDGTIERGRDVKMKGAHCPAFNAHSIAICMVGGVNDDGKPASNYTSDQWASLKTLVFGLWLEYPTITGVCGHRDAPNEKKACPSFDVGMWLKSLDFDGTR